MNNAAAKAAKIKTTTFFGLSPSDVSSAISTCVVVEMETFATDAKVVEEASVGVVLWTEEYLTRVLLIDGIKVGLVSVTMGKKENAKLSLDFSKTPH